MQSVYGSCLRFRDDLQVLTHASVEGTLTSLCLGLIAPYRRYGNDILDWRALDDAGGELVLEHLLGVSAEGREVVGAKLLRAGVVVRGKSVGVRILAGEIADAPGLGRIKIELEPLMTGTEVVDLEAPFAGVVLVAELPDGC